jgi:hypothetical protein
MTFKLDEARIRELAQIEAEANCTIGAGGGIPSQFPMSHLSLQLPQILYQRLEQMAQQEDGFSIDQFVAAAIAEKMAVFWKSASR